MIHRSCDVCGKQIEKSANRTILELGRLRVELLVAVDGAWNGGDVCIDCLLIAVDQGECIERDKQLITARTMDECRWMSGPADGRYTACECGKHVGQWPRWWPAPDAEVVRP